MAFLIWTTVQLSLVLCFIISTLYTSYVKLYTINLGKVSKLLGRGTGDKETLDLFVSNNKFEDAEVIKLSLCNPLGTAAKPVA